MRHALVLALLVSFAGCGGSRHSSDDDYWSSAGSGGTSSDSTSSSTTTSDVDAGTDAGGPIDAGDPVHDRAMALFVRSCTPCHRHQSPVDSDAVARGVYLETDTEILSYANQYTIGSTPTGLGSLVGQRAAGYDLLVGPEQRSPMPPRGSGYAPWTQEEAGQVQQWFRAH